MIEVNARVRFSPEYLSGGSQKERIQRSHPVFHRQGIVSGFAFYGKPENNLTIVNVKWDDGTSGLAFVKHLIEVPSRYRVFQSTTSSRWWVYDTAENPPRPVRSSRTESDAREWAESYEDDDMPADRPKNDRIACNFRLGRETREDLNYLSTRLRTTSSAVIRELVRIAAACERKTEAKK